MASCLYVAPNLAATRIVSHDGLAGTTERHRIEIFDAPTTQNFQPLNELDRVPDLAGVIVEMERGWPGQAHLRFAAKVLKRGRRAWFYWPNESAIEVIDRDRLGTYWRLWAFITINKTSRRIRTGRRSFVQRFRDAAAVVRYGFGRYSAIVAARPSPTVVVTHDEIAAAIAERSRRAMRALLADIEPIPLAEMSGTPGAGQPVEGLGVYLRTDYWA